MLRPRILSGSAIAQSHHLEVLSNQYGPSNTSRASLDGLAVRRRQESQAWRARQEVHQHIRLQTSRYIRPYESHQSPVPRLHRLQPRDRRGNGSTHGAARSIRRLIRSEDTLELGCRRERRLLEEGHESVGEAAYALDVRVAAQACIDGSLGHGIAHEHYSSP